MQILLGSLNPTENIDGNLIMGSPGFYREKRSHVNGGEAFVKAGVQVRRRKEAR